MFSFFFRDSTEKENMVQKINQEIEIVHGNYQGVRLGFPRNLRSKNIPEPLPPPIIF